MNKRGFKKRPISNPERIYTVDEHGWFYDDGNIANHLSGFLKGPPKVHNNINMKNHITKIFNDIGIKNNSKFSSIDTEDADRLSSQVGRLEEDVPSTMWKLLNIANKITDVSQSDPEACGFLKQDGIWSDITNGMIKIKDHACNEMLSCPACNADYLQASNILLAQTVVYHKLTVKVSTNPNDDINMLRPHIVLTPICPQCYLEQLISKIPGTNISPIFTSPDAERHIVPLLPRCMVDKLATDQNANKMTSPMLYWPKTDKDIICDILLDQEVGDDT